MSDFLNIEELNCLLVSPERLSKIYYLPETESTNEYAVAGNLPSDTLVLTSHQTKGKGRFNRNWISSPGKNVALTLVKNFELTVDKIHNVSFYSSLTMHNVLKRFLVKHQNDLKLKWPNDILVNGRKLAGFLLDSKELFQKKKKIFIGVGVNVNEDSFDLELSDKATSVKIETGTNLRLEDIVADFVRSFYDGIELIFDSSTLMKKWKDECEHIGKTVNFRLLSDGEVKPALVKDIALDGSLLLRFDDGKEKTFYSGEISFVKTVPELPTIT